MNNHLFVIHSNQTEILILNFYFPVEYEKLNKSIIFNNKGERKIDKVRILKNSTLSTI